MTLTTSSFEMIPLDPQIHQSLLITENALKKIKAFKEEKGETSSFFLRLSVVGGGCSGLQYNFNFDEKKDDSDVVFQKDTIQVVIDETSLELLSGSVIDYAEDLIGSAFTIKNPKAASSCGCGSSFSII